MTVFDLLFIALFLTGVITIVLAAIAAVGGRWRQGRRLLCRVAVGGVVYLSLVAFVSVLSPRRQLAVGEEQCSDDWCISVATVQRSHGQAADAYEVAFRLASRAARVSQREQHVIVYLRDADGHRYDPRPSDGAIPFDVLLGPLEVATTTRVFQVPSNARGIGVVVARNGAGWFPRCCIIGDDGSFLHKESVVPLQSARESSSQGQS